MALEETAQATSFSHYQLQIDVRGIKHIWSVTPSHQQKHRARVREILSPSQCLQFQSCPYKHTPGIHVTFHKWQRNRYDLSFIGPWCVCVVGRGPSCVKPCEGQQEELLAKVVKKVSSKRNHLNSPERQDSILCDSTVSSVSSFTTSITPAHLQLSSLSALLHSPHRTTWPLFVNT